MAEVFRRKVSFLPQSNPTPGDISGKLSFLGIGPAGCQAKPWVFHSGQPSSGLEEGEKGIPLLPAYGSQSDPGAGRGGLAQPICEPPLTDTGSGRQLGTGPYQKRALYESTPQRGSKGFPIERSKV